VPDCHVVERSCAPSRRSFPVPPCVVDAGPTLFCGFNFFLPQLWFSSVQNDEAHWQVSAVRGLVAAPGLSTRPGGAPVRNLGLASAVRGWVAVVPATSTYACTGSGAHVCCALRVRSYSGSYSDCTKVQCRALVLYSIPSVLENSTRTSVHEDVRK
jgi:hypothetical protein